MDYLCIKGYVGKSDSNDIVRIYLNLNFNEYVEIVKSDILHVEELSTDDLEHGGTCVWIRKDAEITNVKTESLKQQAQFLEGEIARAQLKPVTRFTCCWWRRGRAFSNVICAYMSHGISVIYVWYYMSHTSCNMQPYSRFPCSPRCSGIDYCTRHHIVHNSIVHPRCSPRCGVESAYCPPPPPPW